jgi:hypothetical protein
VATLAEEGGKLRRRIRDGVRARDAAGVKSQPLRLGAEKLQKSTSV